MFLQSQWLYAALAVAVTIFAFVQRQTPKVPYINPPGRFDFFDKRRKLHFLFHARALMHRARQLFPDQPYKMMTDVGETTIIPSKFIDYIRNEPGLSFLQSFADNFHPHLPGFEAFAFGHRPDELIQRTINKRLTKLLNQITAPLSSETEFAANRCFGTPTYWQKFHLKTAILDIVARMSSRVFLGEELCRNEEWLSITKSYAVNSFLAAELLRPYPSWLRSIAQLWLPQCRVLRQQVIDARRVMEPVLQKRKEARQQAIADDLPEPEENDTIGWIEQESRGVPYDPVGGQLGFSVVAIHTTTDLAAEAMLRIVERPGLVDELRHEMIEVLKREGWTKTALFNMKLLDSTIKEAQRLKPITSVVMSRTATRPVTLPNGHILHKGDRCAADTGLMIDPTVYKDPECFNPYRFAEMRSSQGQNRAHLVSTSPEHLGFGHGQHACPGRFFAANEVKILLCHLLIKYDWQLEPGYKPHSREAGFAWSSDDDAMILVRAAEEASLDLGTV